MTCRRSPSGSTRSVRKRWRPAGSRSRASAAAGDYEKLASLAHWLKGSAGTVGFGAFTLPAKALEEAAKLKNADDTVRLIAELDGLVARIEVSVLA